MPFTTKYAYIQEPTAIFEVLRDYFNLSSKKIHQSIDKYRVCSEGQPIIKKSQKVCGKVSVIIFEAKVNSTTPHLLIFETNEFAIFDKPSGLLIHPNKINNERTLLDDIQAIFGNKANIVHRLDKETSGLVLVSKNKLTERDLKECFLRHEVQKIYWAFVKGQLVHSLKIDSKVKHYRFVHQKVEAKAAVSIVKPLKYFKKQNCTLVAVQPKQGRTHQIRIHLFSVGHTILGEPLYGQDETMIDRFLKQQLNTKQRLAMTGAKRLALHAKILKFCYKNKEYEVNSLMNFDISNLI